MNNQEEIRNILGLLGTEHIGHQTAKKLIHHYGSATEVFRESDLQSLSAIERVNEKIIESLKSGPDWKRIDQELEFVQKKGIDIITLGDDRYPRRLRLCDDGPILFFSKGNADFNASKTLAIVGTRRATKRGKELTREIVESLKDENVTIISGLAFGIDIEAHRAALDAGLQTIAVLAHGLDTVYPREHAHEATEMQKNGAVVSELFSKSIPDKENFPKRNRIVAGMSDAVLVIESKRKGGSMITAEIGLSYNRDVFAIPGRPADVLSEGCNFLIKTNRAALVTSAEDIIHSMNWQQKEGKKSIQKKLFIDLDPLEEQVLKAFDERSKLPVDEICAKLELPVSSVSIHLLNLELNGLVRALPGNMYERI